MNCRVDIQEDIKCYQDTFSYGSSKVNYNLGYSLYMLPSNMNLNIRSGNAGYNHKILSSFDTLSVGRNDMVNTLVPSHLAPIILKHAHKTSIVLKHAHEEVPSKHASAIVHAEEKIPLTLVR